MERLREWRPCLLARKTVAVQKQQLEVPDAVEDRIRRRACEIVADVPGADDHLRPWVEALVRSHGPGVCIELLHALTHLPFDETEAPRQWRRVLDHHAAVRERLGAGSGLLVAVLDYFTRIERRFEAPTLVEQRVLEHLRASAYRDELTGLHNYRFFSECIEREIMRSRRYAAPLSLIIVDVDDFKAYNDRFGHDAGNAALMAVGDLLRGALRCVDFATRYGGEEFALILPMCPRSGAMQAARRVQRTIAGHRFDHARLTVSGGVAACPDDAADAGTLVRRADAALYAAKSGGKNQVRFYERRPG